MTCGGTELKLHEFFSLGREGSASSPGSRYIPVGHASELVPQPFSAVLKIRIPARAGNRAPVVNHETTDWAALSCFSWRPLSLWVWRRLTMGFAVELAGSWRATGERSWLLRLANRPLAVHHLAFWAGSDVTALSHVAHLQSTARGLQQHHCRGRLLVTSLS